MNPKSDGLRDADNLTSTPVGCECKLNALVFTAEQMCSKLDQIMLDLGVIRGHTYTIRENTVRCG